MNNKKETPEELRERLKQAESKNNPTGNLSDAMNRARNGVPGDPGGLGWKTTGIVILILVGSYILSALFLK